MSSRQSETSVTVLCGGGGGARLAQGFTAQTDQPSIIVNTADDSLIYGLWISPDLDTVMYTLSDRLDTRQGWGRAEETFTALSALRELGQDTWFTVGDKDLATHIFRTQRLREGSSLTQITAHMCAALGVRAHVLPMSDDPVSSWLETPSGRMAFQEYFVQRGHRDQVHRIDMEGADEASPAPGAADAITGNDVVVIGPSNPFVSVGPILAVPQIREALAKTTSVRMAVSPIIGGTVVKGPAADMLAGLGYDVSAYAVARIYAGLVDVFVIDEHDAQLAGDIEALGMDVLVTNTMMDTMESRARLAGELIEASR